MHEFFLGIMLDLKPLLIELVLIVIIVIDIDDFLHRISVPKKVLS